MAVESDDTSCPQCRKIILRDDDITKPSIDLDDILPVGAILADDYRIARLVGKGGAGTVYEARQTSLRNMHVALKVLHPDINQNENCVTLLKKEVIICRELTHENIIKVYSLEKSQDRHFVVMEYVPGESFQAILKRSGKQSIDQLGPVFLQVCDAMQYAHNRGVLHLDIKPPNIIVSPSGNVKLCDFGIARMAMGTVTTATQRLVIGSPGFMPPEQYTGRSSVSERSDIYALGATVYYSLTGKKPSGASTLAGVPRCVFRALQENPEDRFESIKEFRRAFIRETGYHPAQIGAPGPPMTVDAQDAGDELLSGATQLSAEASVTPPGMVAVDAVAVPETKVQEAATPSPRSDEKLRAPTEGQRGRTWNSFIRERLSRHAILVTICLGLIIMLAVALLLHARQYSAASGTYRVEVAKYEWFDKDRDRKVPAKIYYPRAGKGPFPGVIFSPGLGGSREGAAYLGRCWAKHGYVSVHLTHIGTDSEVAKNSLEPRKALRRALQNPNNILNRPQDVSFVIGQLVRMNSEEGPLKGRVDLDRLGMAGHSLGAFTTLAIAGQVFLTHQGQEETYADPRIKAAIVMSPPLGERQKAHVNHAFKSIAIPCLHMTGTEDYSPLGETGPEDRRIPFDHINGADQYLVIFTGGNHMIFSGRRTSGTKEKDAEFHRLICLSSTAFWDAYLKGEAKAKGWLANGGFKSAMGTAGKFEKKLK